MMEYSLQELEQMLMEWANKAHKLDVEYIKAKESYMILDDIKKITFQRIVDKMDGKTYSTKERSALISQEWSDFMDTYSIHRVAESKAKIERDNAHRTWETVRSIMSLRKNELNRLGG